MKDGERRIEFADEVSRLRYTIAKYKEHDKKRNNYIAHLIRQNETLVEKVKRLEKLTEQQHEEIDELIAAYDGAKPLIADPEHKAWVYELVKKAQQLKEARRIAGQLGRDNNQLKEKNKELADHISALEDIIKRLHNGNK